MGIYDQAARFAGHAAPSAVTDRLLARTGIALLFRSWMDTRTLPLPGGPERIADLVASLEQPDPKQLWLMLLEFQAQIDAQKLDVTLEEVAILRCRARHGPDGQGKYKVAAGLVYLRGKCPEEVLDMTLPNGLGTRHAPLVWNVGEDNAVQTIEGVAAGRLSWGMLFWAPLMAEGGEDETITRWKEVVAATVPDRRMRGNLAGIALIFAELAGCVPTWKRGLEGWEMTESQVVNEWISQGEAKGKLEERRQKLVRLLERKFPGLVPKDVTQLINQQESLELLDDWFDAAIPVGSLDEFLAELRQ